MSDSHSPRSVVVGDQAANRALEFARLPEAPGAARSLEAEGVGFEPTERLTTFNGFRGRHGQRKVPAKRHFDRAEGTREGTKSTNPSTGARGVRWHVAPRPNPGQSTASVRSATAPALSPN